MVTIQPDSSRFGGLQQREDIGKSAKFVRLHVIKLATALALIPWVSLGAPSGLGFGVPEGSGKATESAVPLGLRFRESLTALKARKHPAKLITSMSPVKWACSGIVQVRELHDPIGAIHAEKDMMAEANPKGLLKFRPIPCFAAHHQAPGGLRGPRPPRRDRRYSHRSPGRRDRRGPASRAGPGPEAAVRGAEEADTEEARGGIADEGDSAVS